MKPAWIRGLLGIALAATLGAVYLAPDTQSDAVVPMVRRAANPTSVANAPAAPEVMRVTAQSAVSSATGDADVLAIQPRTLPDESEAVFRVDRTPVPQAAPVNSAPTELLPPPPQAPPLPLKVLGRYIEDGKTKFFLQYNDQNLVVQVGDSIADLYRVESLSGGVLTLRYVPLNQTQTLEVGAAN